MQAPALPTTESALSRWETACLFCDRFTSSAAATWDRPLVETRLFVAVPSLGALLPGWLLIVPKRHRLALADLSDDESLHLREMVEICTGSLASKFDLPIALFEHGPNRLGSPVGCSVDHAHLHVVPTEIPILEVARSLYRDVTWVDLNAIDKRPLGASYIFLQQFGSSHITFGDLPSQLIRTCIAHAVGRAEQWNWRRYPHEEIALETYRALSTVH